MRSAGLIIWALFTLIPSPQTDAPAGIRGFVIDAASNEPVAGAIVELTVPVKGKVERYSDTSRKDGSFEFADLKPGSGYQLVATDVDHQSGAFGQRSEYDPWTPIALTSGQQMTNVRILLVPISSIQGKVVDASGKALSGADVFILRVTYSEDGVRILQQTGLPVQTAPNGEYFYGSLVAGQYYVRVNPANSVAEFRDLFRSPARWDKLPARKLGEPEGYPTVYYPSAMDPASASPVNLLNGGKARNINITATRVHTRRVKGTILVQPGIENSDTRISAGINVLLVPQNAGQESSLTRSLVSRDGQFDFRSVFPGKYTLHAFTSDNKTQMSGQELIDVGDSDIASASVTLAPGVQISGTLKFEDWIQPSPPDYSQFAVVIVPDTRFPIDRTSDGVKFARPKMIAIPSSSGEFVFNGVVAGNYYLVLTINPKLAKDAKVPMDLRAAYMKSAQAGNADVLSGGVHVGKNNESLRIVISSSSGSIYGRVMESDQETAVPARMMLVPGTSNRNRWDLFVPVAVSSTGRFSVVGIPPGDYKIFAWAHADEGAWLDSEFLKFYEDRATPVHIEADSSVGVEVKLIH